MHSFFFSKPQLNCLVLLFVCSVLFLSCEKEVHIDLGSSPPVVVVQGQIETGSVPYVVLTSTMSFFSSIDLSTFEASFIHNAKITVSDGSKTISLKEYSFDTGKNSKFYVYSIDTANLNNLIVGETGKFYTLKIEYKNNIYTSITKIPYPKGVDTMWFAKPMFSGRKTPDSALEMFVNYTDPDTPGNYVRSYSRKNRQQFYPNGLYSDEAVNGIKISNIGMFAGYEDSTNVKRDTARFFFPGDTVTLKWSQIDKGVFTFWNSLYYADQTTGDPFASPINVQTNIKGGAIGIWAGYSTSIKTIIIPK